MFRAASSKSLFTILLLVGAPWAFGQETESEDSAQGSAEPEPQDDEILRVEEEVTVIGDTVGGLNLEEETTTGSRLGLTPMETPASIDVLDSTVMESRGYQQLSDAVDSLPGVVSGEHATAPSTFSIRGFTRAQVVALRDGIWLGPSAMVMRPQNTFNLDRVELLRGPSSVLHGQGAVAGTINAVTKSVQQTPVTLWNGLLSYGNFDTYQAALGVNGPIGESLWYRVNVSGNGSTGYVERMDASSFNVTGSLLWELTANARLKFSLDYLDDELGKYFGTPLIPIEDAVEPMDVIRTTTGETIDERTRFINYNVEDGFARSDQLFGRAELSWDLSPNVQLNNTFYGFRADRAWRNAEGYPYCTGVFDVCTTEGEISRYYGYFLLSHDQDQFGNRLTVDSMGSIGGLDNRASIGLEVMTIDFERARGFRRRVPPAPGDSVDLLNPIPGVYGPEELRGVSPTEIDSWGVFVEDSLALTDNLRLVGALRYDELNLDRVNLNAEGEVEPSGFERKFTWWSWRAGAVFDVREDVALYGQVSSAKDPIGSNIFLVSANQNFDLTDADQWEVGLKVDAQGGRAQWTVAYFDIVRDDVQQRIALDSATTIGGIASNGLELAGTFRPLDGLRLGGNLAYVNAEFEPSPNFDAFAGNTPPNVPDWTFNAWASYEGFWGQPLELGGSFRYVGDRFANNANTIEMTNYALLGIYAAWNFDRIRITGKIDNLTDERYAAWSDIFYLGNTDPSFFYANQLMLGAPRRFSLLMQARF